MNHLGDTNKMSDTPRTDRVLKNCNGWHHVPIEFARELELELNAANKRLEEIEKSGVYEGRPIDKTYLTIHSDVLGTMVSEKAYDPQAKIRELQDRIKRLEEWKEWALAVEREWNANALATMLGGKPGESQRKVIAREVPRLLDRIKRLEEAGDEMEKWCSDWDAASNWEKAKEAKL